MVSNSRIAGEVKVGRSKDVVERVKGLSQSQNYHIVVQHTYAGQGYLEPVIHQRLKKRRLNDYPGREWFACDPATVNTIIQGAIAEVSLG